MMNEWAVTTDWLHARTKASPLATALLTDGHTFTFQDLDRLVTRFCAFFDQQGVRRGDHIGMLMPNSLAAVCCVFAATRISAVLIPLNTRLTPTELGWQIKRAECSSIFCQPSLETKARAAAHPLVTVISVPENTAEFAGWLALQSLAMSDFSPSDSLDSVQAIIFTSGTTGFPKGAMITFSNLLWSAVGSAFKLGSRPDDRWLACLPLYHVGGLSVLFRSCLYGTAVVLQNGFDVDVIQNSLITDSITLVSLVPTMLARLLTMGLSGAHLPSLRLVLLGGAAASPELLAKAAAAGLPVAVTYGLTEACSQVATLLPAGSLRKPGCAGKPLLFTDVRIIDEDGRSKETGQPGEIVVAGPTVMAGYYADAEATATALSGGYLHTGDIGFLDEDGDLWVLNRRGDLIVSGGENVYPAEVEQVLQAHPLVAAASVVGLPHSDWGQQVAALVVLKQSQAISKEDLTLYLRDKLAGYKRPQLLVITDEMPITGSGKIQRSEVLKYLAAQMEPA